ncbi:MAG: hypothetical protein QXV69_05500 [Sulfolobaceae archaeon]
MGEITINEVKKKIEEILREREWITYSELLKYLPYPAPLISDALMLLLKEEKISRRGRYLYYKR